MRTLILAAALALPGCATIITGSSDSVSFDSQPEGARVVVDGQVVGKTPCQAAVSRGWRMGKVRIELGDAVREGEVPRVLNGWMWGNLLFGGMIGFWLVDFPTGNYLRADTEAVVFADFEKPGASVKLVRPPKPKKPPREDPSTPGDWN